MGQQVTYFGTTETLGDQISVTVIATGFEHDNPKEKLMPEESKIVVSLDDDEPKKNFQQSLADIGHEEPAEPAQPTNTIEFEDLKSRYQRYSYEDPYVKNEERERQEEERYRRHQEEMARREQQRRRVSKTKLSNPQTIVDLENEPAYLRRKIRLDDVTHSADEDMSEWTIRDEETPELRSSGNSFLHDNVD